MEREGTGRREPRAGRRLEVVAGAGALAFVAFLVVTPGSDRFVNAVDNLVQLGMASVAAAAAAVVAGRSSGRLRTSWTLIALASASWAAGQAAWSWSEVVLDQPVSAPSVADIGFLALIPLLLVGLVRYPAAGLLPISRLRLALDATTLAVGMLFALQATFHGAVIDVDDPWAAEHLVTLAYPVADVIALAIVVPVMLRRHEGRHGPLPLLVAGLVGLTVSDAYFAYVTTGDGSLLDNPANAGWAVGFGLFALAARRVRPDRPLEAAPDLHPVLWGEDLVPVVPVLLAATTLAARVVRGEDIGSFLAVSGAVLLGVVALRQLVVQRENSELTDDLRDTVEQLHAREDELRFRAFHDPLTGLANRDLFRDRLGHALSLRRHDPVAVAFIDLDDFKTVNDSLGHDAGDELLRLVAERIRACVRSGDTVARLGGDEFAALIEDPAAVDGLVERILDAFELPFRIGLRELHITASIGVSSGVPGRHDAPQLLQDADLAMYAAKAAGKGRVEQFRPALREGALERLDVIADLDGAVERGELFLEYQPVERLADGATTGYEALLRWQHPTRGLLAPAAFLAVAEETGRMEAIGWWTLEEAFRAQRLFPVPEAGPQPWISVNLSARQLLASSAEQALAHAIAVSGIDPGRVVVELTEETLLAGPEVDQRIASLHDAGVRLAIDDFGTGYSSLSYLARLPVDIVKIDRSFVASMQPDEPDLLIGAIVQLARGLGIKTIAEGVEHDWQLERLVALGCDGAQGYALGRPGPAPGAAGVTARAATNEPPPPPPPARAAAG
jgi:diguanylate cyclase (GGDEF)-like protein